MVTIKRWIFRSLTEPYDNWRDKSTLILYKYTLSVYFSFSQNTEFPNQYNTRGCEKRSNKKLESNDSRKTEQILFVSVTLCGYALLTHTILLNPIQYWLYKIIRKETTEKQILRRLTHDKHCYSLFNIWYEKLTTKSLHPLND